MFSRGEGENRQQGLPEGKGEGMKTCFFQSFSDKNLKIVPFFVNEKNYQTYFCFYFLIFLKTKMEIRTLK